MASGVPNSDYMADPFPGIRWCGRLSPGGDQGSAPPPDATTTTVTSPTGASWDRSTVPTHGTTMPGQTQLDWMGVDQNGITSTGAGQGVTVSATSHGRYPWQQAAT